MFFLRDHKHGGSNNAPFAQEITQLNDLFRFFSNQLIPPFVERFPPSEAGGGALWFQPRDGKLFKTSSIILEIFEPPRKKVGGCQHHSHTPSVLPAA